VKQKFSEIGERTMLLNATQIEQVNGNQKLILLAIEDITEQKQKEESPDANTPLPDQYLDILFNHADLPIIIWNSSLDIFISKPAIRAIMHKHFSPSYQNG
jgi:hypothetical protein